MIPSTSSQPGAEAGVITLKVGDEAFWDGPEGIHQPLPQVAFDLLRIDDLCGVGSVRCIDYRIEVEDPAWRLRVAFDTPDDFDAENGDSFDLYLYDPAGQLVDTAGKGGEAYPFHRFAGEAFAESPEVGSWTARMVVFRASDATFRMRAKLEEEPKRPAGRRPLLPNMRISPPFELTFATPVAVATGPSIYGSPTNGCLADEMAQYSPTRCLRFSMGPVNVGDGPLDLVFVPGVDATRGEVVQRIQHSTGPSSERPAGTYEYHATHTHYHHAGFTLPELYRVVDPAKGRLQLVATGHKVGFCMYDIALVGWRTFNNDAGTHPWSSCHGGVAEDPLQGQTVGLSRGWSDNYPYTLPGNFIDFGNNPDGLYVVRLKANQSDSIHESNYQDNFSYAYFKVTGDEIEVLARGYGKSPWDPHASPADDIRNGVADH